MYEGNDEDGWIVLTEPDKDADMRRERYEFMSTLPLYDALVLFNFL